MVLRSYGRGINHVTAGGCKVLLKINCRYTYMLADFDIYWLILTSVSGY